MLKELRKMHSLKIVFIGTCQLGEQEG